MKNIILGILTLAFALNVSAQEKEIPSRDEENLTPILMTNVYKVKSGDTRIIPLPRYTFVDRMMFEVKPSLLCSSDNFRMSFDGYNARSVDYSAGLKGYKTKILTVDARTRTIEVYNTSDCTIYIKDIQVLPRRWQRGHNQHPGSMTGYVSDAAAQVSFLLETLIYVEALVGDAERMQYLSPGKKVIGKALAVLNNVPETSQASLNAIKEVIDYLKMIRPFVDRLTSIETTFEVAQEIQMVEASLERMIR